MKRAASRLAAVCTLAALSARADVPLAAASDQRVVLPPRVEGSRGAAARFTLGALIPPQPWTHVRRPHVSGLAAAPPLPRPDGSLIVGLHDHSLVRIAPDGSTTSLASLESENDEASGRMVAGVDGMLFVMGANHSLYVLAPDHTVRATYGFASPREQVDGPFARADGSVVIAAGQEVQVFSPQGSLVAVRRLPSALLRGSQSGDGCIWLAMRDAIPRDAGGVACFAPDDTLRPPIPVRAMGGIVGIAGSGVVVVTAGDVQLRAGDGTLRGRLDTAGAGAPHIAPQPNGGVAFYRNEGTPREVVVFGREGSVTARWAIPGEGQVAGVFGDVSGAMVVLMANGRLTALEADGTVRWTASLDLGGRQIRPEVPAVPLATGGLAIPLDSGELVLLD